ncbi:sugar transferase [Niastella koreensis GR20-10]|uniref:Sugar transferase n=1 Tax=Niastella koreensis (strain DSM 17620 / KACC 11465 / NBRC 106392 / GR20-10) TaxID=700598 RepID=G8TEY7_NIAKG|nr:sugar transferase [Niastella koreensis]AEW01575.1 sugar transferase [Niastella koreensis GR20-10]
MQLYRNFLKRVFDFIVSLIAFGLLLPLFILVTALLYLANQGSPFFVQPRPGKNGRIFKLVKFKTMNDKKDAAGNLLSDAERLTAIGGFIRKTSLDEIPQLINVIKGEMSLIGPRPLLVEYLPLYNDMQRRRHEVRPGITGWAQVNGRNAIGWQRKFELDVWYVDHVSFTLDCKIAFFTIMKVVKSEGVSQTGHVTMTKFQGN